MKQTSSWSIQALADWVTASTKLLDSLPSIAGQPAEISYKLQACLKCLTLARSTVIREARTLGDTVLGESLTAFDDAERLIEHCCKQWGKSALQLHSSLGSSPITSMNQARRAIERVSRLADFFEPDTEQTTLPIDRLTDHELELWHLLEGKALTGKEISRLLSEKPNPQTVAKRIQRIRKKGLNISNQREGTKGYYRPDAPPKSFP